MSKLTDNQNMVVSIIQMDDKELIEELTRPLDKTEWNRMVEREALRRLLKRKDDGNQILLMVRDMINTNFDSLTILKFINLYFKEE